MPGIEGVLFDYGGTLVTFEYPTGSLVRMLETFRPRIEGEAGVAAPSPVDLLRMVLLPLEDYVSSQSESEVNYMSVFRAAWSGAGFRLSESLLHEILDAEQRCWDQAVAVDPGAWSVLAELTRRGVRRGICSNAPFPAPMMQRQLKSNGLAREIQAAVFSSAVGRRKPAPEIYLAALAALGTPADATLFVGNRVREDHDGPRRMGMSALILRRGHGERVPEGVPAIDSLPELLGWL